MNKVNVFFSDFFDIEEKIIEEYGAVNISLLNDMPLFIDPFLLYNSENADIRSIHDEMIDYLKFLKRQSGLFDELSDGMRKAWYTFSEVKQTWLGFSLDGNSGRGLGKEFAENLFSGLNSIFRSFGKETITKDAHMEKLCLICPKVGRDKISDFTAHFAKQYLLSYTEKFAYKYIDPKFCRKVKVPEVKFDYSLQVWVAGTYYLPFYGNDYVLLTPKCILTGDDTFINRSDMLKRLQDIIPSIDDDELRFEVNNHFCNQLREKDNKLTKIEREHATELLIRKYPKIIDYYIRYKEEREQEAVDFSKNEVEQANLLFIVQVQLLVNLLKDNTQFYNTIPDAHNEAKQRLLYLKHVIEDQEGYKLFYVKGKPIKRESDLQVIYRLVWYGCNFDVNREVNNGRGPVDYKISFGKNNSTLVEFKLASNSKLKQNLANQVEIYKKASETNRALKVILYFSKDEYDKVIKTLDELSIRECPDIILIDARNDNKESASNVKMSN